ncbi:hypothetical protein A3A67_01975 [Candidatus Peribacteria bacterium RIFCSPLOWO2_01_FULL_51_18]|nr:MAG: hypothetical protein A3A67_01975 [Candidatus Peribacteria bacterium RIFCSPLOWO2_01_FULL_51_18]
MFLIAHDSQLKASLIQELQISIVLGAKARSGAAAKESLRLFTKNTGPCEAVRQCIGADAWPVLEGHVRGCMPPI